MNIISELYNGNLSCSILSIRRDSEYYKMHNKLSAILDELGRTASKETMDKLSEMLSILDGITGEAYFALGFKWGAQLIHAATDGLDTDTFLIKYPL